MNMKKRLSAVVALTLTAVLLLLPMTVRADDAVYTPADSFTAPDGGSSSYAVEQEPAYDGYDSGYGYYGYTDGDGYTDGYGYYGYDDGYTDRASGNSGAGIAIVLVLSLIIAFITVSIQKSGMKSAVLQRSAAEYIDRSTLVVDVREEVCTGSRIMKTEKNRGQAPGGPAGRPAGGPGGRPNGRP